MKQTRDPQNSTVCHLAWLQPLGTGDGVALEDPLFISTDDTVEKPFTMWKELLTQLDKIPHETSTYSVFTVAPQFSIFHLYTLEHS